MDITIALPAECISNIISLTTPRDACRLSVVSPVFKSAADSDSVWENFLPSDRGDLLNPSSRVTLIQLSECAIVTACQDGVSAWHKTRTTRIDEHADSFSRTPPQSNIYA
ncbi:hypothetical protein CUMW_276050 [Citrus unshiu]|uniref:F-box domain-containing protein n=1 Tax=Citrus unshiu TaxID=55188 RepID=A0A2H5N2D0_CITUN|nr:hypothetical protein CUMW_276050 [Citrus unshiu]